MDEDLDSYSLSLLSQLKTDRKHSLGVELPRLGDMPPTQRFRNTHSLLSPRFSFMYASEQAYPQVCCIDGLTCSDTCQRHMAGSYNWSFNLNSPTRAQFSSWIQHTWQSATEKNQRWISFVLGGARNVKLGFMWSEKTRVRKIFGIETFIILQGSR